MVYIPKGQRFKAQRVKRLLLTYVCRVYFFPYLFSSFRLLSVFDLILAVKLGTEKSGTKKLYYLLLKSRR